MTAISDFLLYSRNYLAYANARSPETTPTAGELTAKSSLITAWGLLSSSEKLKIQQNGCLVLAIKTAAAGA
jgi:hypothetical protein